MKVGIIGAGTMGSGIAQAFAQTEGYEVFLCDINEEFAANGKKKIAKGFEKRIAKGKMTQETADAVLAKITTGVKTICTDCDLVVEAALENMQIKKQTFKELQDICKADCIFATNTSSLSITEIGAGLDRPVIGMHFFNPAPVMKLVEVIAGLNTPEEVVEKIKAISVEIGKTPVQVNEAAGFVVNRILVPMINEAVGIYADGVASVEDIDTAMKLGANHPMGPLALGDLIEYKIMDFTLDKKHEMARQLFRDFAEKEVKPLAIEVDETEEFPRVTVDKMIKAGFMGIPVPKEYGGQGCDPLTYAMCVEELSKVCGTTGVIVSAHTSLCCDPIMTFGTEEQKQKFLVPLAKGEKLGAFGLTEPGAGTDAQGQQTKAVLDGDEWVLNGSKCFITNGKEADVYVIFAVTGVVEKRGRKMKEISAFIVEKGTPGFTFGTKEKKMGIRGSSTYELIFQDCRIPKENLLGQQGKGFNIAMHTLDGGRIGIASQALGIAEGALERTIAYVKERKQFGRAIGAFQNTQFQLADMATKVEAAQLLVYKAAMAKATQKTYSVEAAKAKLYAAEVAMEVTTKAVQLHGGYGYTREYEVERMMRDAKITEIYEGTSEVQRMVISGALLK